MLERRWSEPLPPGCYSLTVAENVPALARTRLRPLSSLVEHFLGKEEVVGPIPTGGSVSPITLRSQETAAG